MAFHNEYGLVLVSALFKLFIQLFVRLGVVQIHTYMLRFRESQSNIAKVRVYKIIVLTSAQTRHHN